MKALALAVMCAILAGGYSGVGTVYAADQTFDGNITVTGNITAAGGKVKTEDENNKFIFKAGNLIITTDKNAQGQLYQNITFSDANATGYEITLADIVATRDRTKTLSSTGSKSYENFTDTFTSLGGKLRVYDKRRVGAGDETSLDLVTINEGYQNQVAIDTVDGIVISHQGNDNSATTAAMNEKGVFAGGKDYANAKAGMKNEDGSLKAVDGKFTVEQKSSNGNSYAKATVGGYMNEQGQYNYLINLEAANYGGIEVKGKDGGGNANYDMAKLGTNGIIYSTKGLILGAEKVGGEWTYADADSAKFYVNADDGNVISKGTITAADNKFLVKEDGKVQIEDELVISHAGSATAADPGRSATLNIDNLTAINKLIKVTEGVNSTVVYDTSGKPVITAGSGSTIGGVTISDGQLAVSQGTVNVTDLVKDHELVNDDYKGNERLNSRINSLETSDAALTAKTRGIGRFLDNSGNPIGTVIENKLYVYDDGTLSAADDKFTVSADGKLISASGSKIGDVTINGESLSNGTKSVKVSELKDDHDLVNDAKKGNESLYTGLGNVQTLAQGLGSKTAGIARDTIGTATTTIEGKLKVGSDGTVKINEGADQQVIIDSNGIKVGKNSSRMNDSYGFATTRDLYVGADSADAPTAAGSKFYVKGADGSIKAANGKFTVGADGDITASGLNTTTINVGANNTVNPEFTVDKDGNLISRGTLSAFNGQFYFGADGLNIGNGNFTVDRTSGNVVTNGSITLNHGATTTTIEGETVTVSTSGVNKSFNLSDIADVGQNMTNLGNRVGNVETSINDVKQDVTNLGNRVGNVETSINDVKQDVTNLGNRIDDVNSRVDNINADFTSRIDTVQSNVDAEKAERQEDVANLGNRIDTVSNNLGDLNDLDNDLRARDEYTSNSSVVGGINAEAAIRKEEVSRLDTAIADEAAARQADVARLDGRISDISSRLNKVGAMSAAIASLKTMGYDPESPTEFSVGLGQYKGETGVALGFFHYPNKNFMINVSLSTSSGEIMGGIGATWRFGHKSPQKLLEEQRAAQAEKEIAAAEAYKAARAAKQAKNAK